MQGSSLIRSLPVSPCRDTCFSEVPDEHTDPQPTVHLFSPGAPSHTTRCLTGAHGTPGTQSVDVSKRFLTPWQCGEHGRRASARARGAGRGPLLFESDMILARGLAFPLPSLRVSLHLHGSVPWVLPVHTLGTPSVTSCTCPWPFTPLSSFTDSSLLKNRGQ